MKKIFSTLVVSLAVAATALAQQIAAADVPAPVLTKFGSVFSTTETVSWELDYDNYIAKFRNNKVEIQVTFDKDGKWLTTETPIAHSVLPASVKSCLTKQFDSYQENDIEKVETPQGITYSVDLECNRLNYEVVVSDIGELVSRKEVREYKRED